MKSCNDCYYCRFRVSEHGWKNRHGQVFVSVRPNPYKEARGPKAFVCVKHYRWFNYPFLHGLRCKSYIGLEERYG